MKSYDDGAFTIDEGNWGFQSFDREGRKIILSATEWECEMWTRRWIKAQQEGWTDSRVVNDGKVAGKL